MRRGDIVTVAAPGDDYGKPRPAVVVQTDAFPAAHESVIVCPMTSDIVDAPDFRIVIAPGDTTGLRAPSQIMVGKPVTLHRRRIGKVVGRLEPDTTRRLNIALAFVLGLAD